MAAYPYKALSLPHETRVLTLSPGEGGDKLACGLSHMQIDSPGQYDALSYCWSKSVSHPPDIDFDEEYPVALYGEGINVARTVRLRDALGDRNLDSFYIRFGGVLPPEEAICDGVTIEIGGELARALRCMRDDKEPLRIWVDALCINQDDVQERNEHVKMMGSIYSRAAKVRVWLGDEIGIELHADWALSRISAICEEIFTPGSDPAEMTTKFLRHRNADGIEWDILGGFLRRSWFERSWVIQEVANAKEVTIQSGRFKLPWDFFHAVISILRHLRIDGVMNHPNGVKAVVMMGNLRQERKESNGAPVQQPLLELLEELRSFQSTIPADKIYALLGLVSPREEIAADYGKTSEEIFTDFAVQQLQTGSLDILTHCVFSPRPSVLHDLPSWVPDWTRPGAVEPFRIRGLRVTAAGDTKPQITCIDRASGTLKLKGRLLDTVDAVDDKAHIPWEETDDIFVIKPNPDGSPPEFQDPAQRNLRRNEEDRTRIKASIDNIMTTIVFPDSRFTWEQYEAAWRTFMCNQTRENEIPGPGYGPCWEQMMAYLSSRKHPGEILERMGAPNLPFPESQTPIFKRTSPSGSGARSTLSIRSGPNGDLEQILNDIDTTDDEKEEEHFAGMTRTMMGAHSRWCYRRRFYRSGSGRYGWTVHGARNGDAVVLFYGCDYPFILRDEGNGTYRIIGDCYIHGLMDGAGLGEEYPDKEFHLI